MADVTISASGAHATAAATDRIPASKEPFTPGTKGYHTPETIRAYLIATANAWTAAQTISGTTLGFSGNQSKAAWTTTGTKLLDAPGTLTDTSSSGTVAAAYTNVLGGDTIAASAATTFTDYYTLFIKEPTAGSNVTATNKWALGLLGSLNVSGKILVGVGAVGAPSIAFAGNPNTGMWSTSPGNISFSAGSTERWRMGSGGDFSIQGAVNVGGVAVPLLVLRADAAGVLAQRNSTAAQSLLIYDTYGGATDYHRSGIQSARATLSNVTGASVTASGLVPDGALLIGVTTKVTTALGTSLGATGYTVGDGSDVDRWGDITGTALGTSSDNTNMTATTAQFFTSAQDVVITPKVGIFDGTGVIRVTAFYMRAECD